MDAVMPCNFPVSPKIPFAEEEERKEGTLARSFSQSPSRKTRFRKGGRATNWRDPLSNFPLDNFFLRNFFYDRGKKNCPSSFYSSFPSNPGRAVHFQYVSSMGGLSG